MLLTLIQRAAIAPVCALPDIPGFQSQKASAHGESHARKSGPPPRASKRRHRLDVGQMCCHGHTHARARERDRSATGGAATATRTRERERHRSATGGAAVTSRTATSGPQRERCVRLRRRHDHQHARQRDREWTTAPSCYLATTRRREATSSNSTAASRRPQDCARVYWVPGATTGTCELRHREPPAHHATTDKSPPRDHDH
jgi:hypothetical protein